MGTTRAAAAEFPMVAVHRPDRGSGPAWQAPTRSGIAVKRPNTSIAFVRETHLFGDTASFAHYLGGLRMAGLPD